MSFLGICFISEKKKSAMYLVFAGNDVAENQAQKNTENYFLLLTFFKMENKELYIVCAKSFILYSHYTT